jgi:hypothetical protein
MLEKIVVSSSGTMTVVNLKLVQVQMLSSRRGHAAQGSFFGRKYTFVDLQYRDLRKRALQCLLSIVAEGINTAFGYSKSWIYGSNIAGRL